MGACEPSVEGRKAPLAGGPSARGIQRVTPNESRYILLVRTLSAPIRWVWDLMVLALVAVLCGVAVTLPMSENDSFLHVLMGRDILGEGRLTGNPDWTFGPTNPDWITFVHWPTQVLMAAGYDALGFGFFTALGVALAGAFLLTMFIALQAVRGTAEAATVGQARLQAGVLFYSCLAVGVFISPRANAFSAVFAVLLGYWCVSIIRSGSFGMRWWLVLIAVWGWVLLHGSAMLAAVLLLPSVALWWAIQPTRFAKPTLITTLRLLAVAVAAAVIPVLTPLGLRAWETGISTREASAGWIVEWTTLEAVSYEGLFLAVLVLWAAIVGVFTLRTGGTREKAQQLAVLALIGFVVIPAIVFQQRNYILFMPAAIVLLFAVTSQLLERSQFHPRSWEGITRALRVSHVFALGAAMCLLLVAVASFQNSLNTYKFPVSIAENMEKATGAHPRYVIAPIEVASVIPFYSPGDRVAFDARLDRYPREVLVRATGILNGNGGKEWEAWIDEVFPETTDLLVRRTSPFVQQAQEAGWVVTDETERWLLLSRQR